MEPCYNKQIYVGNVKGGLKVHAIKEFMEQKDVPPTFLCMMKSKQRGTVGENKCYSS